MLVIDSCADVSQTNSNIAVTSNTKLREIIFSFFPSLCNLSWLCRYEVNDCSSEEIFPTASIIVYHSH